MNNAVADAEELGKFGDISDEESCLIVLIICFVPVFVLFFFFFFSLSSIVTTAHHRLCCNVGSKSRGAVCKWLLLVAACCFASP